MEDLRKSLSSKALVALLASAPIVAEEQVLVEEYRAEGWGNRKARRKAAALARRERGKATGAALRALRREGK